MNGRPDPLAPFLEELSHLSVDDLAVLALPAPDPVERAVLLARAEAAATEAGRLDAFRAAPGRSREALGTEFAFRGFDPTWFGLNWGRSLGRSEDRVHLIAAVEDAACASIVADVLPPGDVAALREPFELASSMTGAAPAASPDIDGSRARRTAVVAGIVATLFVIGTAANVFAVAALVAFGRRRRRGRE